MTKVTPVLVVEPALVGAASGPVELAAEVATGPAVLSLVVSVTDLVEVVDLVEVADDEAMATLTSEEASPETAEVMVVADS